MRALVLTLVTLLVAACGKGKETKQEPPPKPADAPAAPTTEQVKPKLDLKTPPPDAVKTPSGLVYKKLVENAAGTSPKRNDTVLVNYTGWKQASGVTFFTNRGQGQPLPLSLATTAPGFAEALQIAHKGETVMAWIPGDKETLVYELELVDVAAAPPVPPDLAAPPATAKTTKHGAKYIVVKPGRAETARSFDTVTFDYTAWSTDGRMFDTTEMRKRPATASPHRQAPVIEDILTLVGKGERVRVWTDAKAMSFGSAPAGMPQGPLVYEIQLNEITKAAGEPAPTPPDVAAAPADAKKTPNGVAYKVLKAGAGGPKPGPTETVKIVFTSWTTEGRLVSSSRLEGKPTDLALNNTITGLTEGIMQMSAGDHVRMWIPDTLAYKGVPNKPQGTIVYDVELISFDAKPAEQFATAAPPDVAGPPANAKKSASGVAYKILRAKTSGKRPTPKDTVRVIFTGWTTDGTMFDSSKGKPYETKLTNVIDGWAETIPLLMVGEKVRMWIPERLAYDGQEGAPKGMLVFDLELLEIVK